MYPPTAPARPTEQPIGDPFGRRGLDGDRWRRRVGVGALTLMTFAGGFAAGYAWSEARRQSRERIEAQTGSWELVPIPVGKLCSQPEAAVVAVAPLPEGPRRPRLADYLLDRSPVTRFRLTTQGPGIPQVVPEGPVPQVTDPTSDLAAAGVVAAYTRGFVDPNAPGGFSTSVFEFDDPRSARLGAAAAYRTAVCDLARDPVSIPEAPSVLAVSSEISGGSMTAWWVAGARVYEVGVSVWEPPGRHIEEGLIIVEAQLTTARGAEDSTA